MSVELCSTIIGKVKATIKGEPQTIVFEDKGGIGFAVVSDDAAEKLLQIPGYWKPGQRNISTEDAVKTALENDPEAASAAEALIKGKRHENSVAQVVELIKLSETIEELESIVAGDERSGVMTAASKRRAQLNKE